MNTVKVTTINSELVDNTKSTKNKEIEVNKNIVEMKNTGNWEEDFTFGLGICMGNGETNYQTVSWRFWLAEFTVTLFRLVQLSKYILNQWPLNHNPLRYEEKMFKRFIFICNLTFKISKYVIQFYTKYNNTYKLLTIWTSF